MDQASYRVRKLKPNCLSSYLYCAFILLSRSTDYPSIVHRRFIILKGRPQIENWKEMKSISDWGIDLQFNHQLTHDILSRSIIREESEFCSVEIWWCEDGRWFKPPNIEILMI